MIIVPTLKKERAKGRKTRLDISDVIRRENQRRAEKQLIRIKKTLLDEQKAAFRARGIIF